MSAAAFGTGKYTKDSQLPNLSSLAAARHATPSSRTTASAPAARAPPSRSRRRRSSRCNIPFAELGMQLGAETIHVAGREVRVQPGARASRSPCRDERVPALHRRRAARAGRRSVSSTTGRRRCRWRWSRPASRTAERSCTRTWSTRSGSAICRRSRASRPRCSTRRSTQENADTIKQMMVDGVDHGVAS